MQEDFSRITSFINSFNKDDEGYLGEIYENAIKDNVPVIRREARELLKVLIMMKKPSRILEIGTAVGYSSLYMAKYGSCNLRIDTIELDEDRADIAERNIERLGMHGTINVIRGDANIKLKELKGPYDLIFVDAAKGQYVNYYEEVIRLTESGGVILSDNVLAGGDILESHFLVTKRDRTIHDRMRDYLYTIKNDTRLETAIISLGDGMAISVRK